jgi:uncharacterized phage-associated protein
MVRAIDIAKYLIHLAAPEESEDIDCLSHLRLQKLLYYVQGWHLAVCGQPLFPGRIEAWKHGPVVREIYPDFADFGYRAIPPSCGGEPESLSSREKAFVASVWEHYKGYSATALRDMTHNETPWLKARAGCSPTERSENEIAHEWMIEFFRPQLPKLLAEREPLIKPVTWEKATAAIQAGQTRTLQEIRLELRRRRASADQG